MPPRAIFSLLIICNKKRLCAARCRKRHTGDRQLKRHFIHICHSIISTFPRNGCRVGCAISTTFFCFSSKLEIRHFQSTSMRRLPVGRSHAPVTPRHYVPNPAPAALKALSRQDFDQLNLTSNSWKSELPLKTNLQRTLLVAITAPPFRGGRRGVVTSQHTEAGRDNS